MPRLLPPARLPALPALSPAPALSAARRRLPSRRARSERVTRNAVRMAVAASVMKPTTVAAAMMVDEPEWVSTLPTRVGWVLVS